LKRSCTFKKESNFNTEVTGTEAWVKAIETLSLIEPSTPNRNTTGTPSVVFYENHVEP